MKIFEHVLVLHSTTHREWNVITTATILSFRMTVIRREKQETGYKSNPPGMWDCIYPIGLARFDPNLTISPDNPVMFHESSLRWQHRRFGSIKMK